MGINNFWCMERGARWIMWYVLVKGRNVKDMENAMSAEHIIIR